MRTELWPESRFEEHLAELESIFDGEPFSTLPIATFIAVDAQDTRIGFLDAGLRSHADGCDGRRAVGYIEGWFVRQEFRERGVGRLLVEAAEDWARAQGCKEMASDALVDNAVSQRAHESIGYEVVDRCVHYRKVI
jgi:aminoglycoside 6'-N-acetyltransferase I